MFGTVAAAGVNMLSDVVRNRRDTIIVAIALSVGLGLQLRAEALQHLTQQERFEMSAASRKAGQRVPRRGLPARDELPSGRTVTTGSYAVIPRGVQTDIATSLLPYWSHTRLRVLARPMSGIGAALGLHRARAAPQPSPTEDGSERQDRR